NNAGEPLARELPRRGAPVGGRHRVVLGCETSQPEVDVTREREPFGGYADRRAVQRDFMGDRLRGRAERARVHELALAQALVVGPAACPKRTPSRLARKTCDSSAVIVTAWAAPAARCSAASRASREPSAVGSRWIS